jgi:hypothetical protein
MFGNVVATNAGDAVGPCEPDVRAAVRSAIAFPGRGGRRESARPTDYRGSGALLHLYSRERITMRKWHLQKLSRFVMLQPGLFEVVASGYQGLPGFLPYNPRSSVLRMSHHAYIA